MRELPRKDIAEDLGIAVRMRGEAGLSRDAVFIEDSKAAEGLELRGVVGREGECVVGVEPAMVGVAARGGGAQGEFCVGHYLGNS